MHGSPRLIFALLLFLCALPAQAQSEAAQLRESLAALNAEQQSVYQQFQMLQSLRAQTKASLTEPPQPGPPGDYEEVTQRRQAANDELQRYQSDMDALYTRYKELDEQKKPLLARMRELALQPPPAAPPLAAPARTAKPAGR